MSLDYVLPSYKSCNRFGTYITVAMNTSNLRAPAWPVKRILGNIASYQESIALRNVKLAHNYDAAKFQELHTQLLNAQNIRQKVATDRNALVTRIKNSVGKDVVKDSLKGDLLRQSRVLKEKLKQVEGEVTSLQAVYNDVLDSIPNVTSERAAAVQGEFKELEFLNQKPVEADKSREHTEIGKKLNIIDISSGSRVSGTGSYYLVGDGALLEQALIQYALERCRQHGFTMVSPPQMVRTEFTSACGFRPRDQNDEVQVYQVKGGAGQTDLCLAGTAEIPLASWKAHKKLDVASPVSVCGVSKSFRAEAGARGADTKGLYRVHEFSKVEMFQWTKADVTVSTAALDKLLALQKQIIGDLGLTARVLQIGPTDLGAPAYEKFDIEAWMPGRGSWGELTSASNCLDYQSRRLWTVDADGEFVHTLNATALAIPRVIIAILENFYEPEHNRVAVPEVLHRWMPKYIEAGSLAC